MPTKVNALVCNSLTKDLSGLAFEAIEIGELSAESLLIRVKAASVNFPDLLMSQGLYQHKPNLRFPHATNGYAIIYQDADGNTCFNKSHVIYLGSQLPPKKDTLCQL